MDELITKKSILYKILLPFRLYKHKRELKKIVNNLWKGYKKVRGQVEKVQKDISIFVKIANTSEIKTDVDKRLKDDVLTAERRCNLVIKRLDQYERYIREENYKDAAYIIRFAVTDLSELQKYMKEVENRIMKL